MQRGYSRIFSLWKLRLRPYCQVFYSFVTPKTQHWTLSPITSPFNKHYWKVSLLPTIINNWIHDIDAKFLAFKQWASQNSQFMIKWNYLLQFQVSWKIWQSMINLRLHLQKRGMKGCALQSSTLNHIQEVSHLLSGFTQVLHRLFCLFLHVSSHDSKKIPKLRRTNKRIISKSSCIACHTPICTTPSQSQFNNLSSDHVSDHHEDEEFMSRLESRDKFSQIFWVLAYLVISYKTVTIMREESLDWRDQWTWEKGGLSFLNPRPWSTTPQ